MSSKTNFLRAVITSNLDTIVKTYYRFADAKADFPHAVYDFENVDLGDISRDDLILIIDLWGKGKDTSAFYISSGLQPAFFTFENSSKIDDCRRPAQSSQLHAVLEQRSFDRISALNKESTQYGKSHKKKCRKSRCAKKDRNNDN